MTGGGALVTPSPSKKGVINSGSHVRVDRVGEPVKKHYISTHKLLEDAYRLGWNIFESNYRPNWVVSILRGGAPIGIAVHELLSFLGVQSEHMAVSSTSYTRHQQRKDPVLGYGLADLLGQLSPDDSLLIVDDVYDTGLSIKQVVDRLTEAYALKAPTIRVATLYFKPENNQTKSAPDYYLHETNHWLVFPHELHGLTLTEIRQHKPEMADLINHSAFVMQHHPFDPDP